MRLRQHLCYRRPEKPVTNSQNIEWAGEVCAPRIRLGLVLLNLFGNDPETVMQLGGQEGIEKSSRRISPTWENEQQNVGKCKVRHVGEKKSKLPI